jgi:hypothetical protein
VLGQWEAHSFENQLNSCDVRKMGNNKESKKKRIIISNNLKVQSIFHG